jgi:hypothetical protein
MSSNAVTDFSLAHNPNGVWTYLVDSGGSVIPLSQAVDNDPSFPGLDYWGNAGSGTGLALIGLNTSGSTQTYGTVVVPTDVLDMNPESLADVDLRFIAPVSGTYSISGDFSGLDTSETSHSVLVLDNGIMVFSGDIRSYQAASYFTLNETLAAGGSIDFVVDSGASANGLSTGLAATVTVACFCAGTRILTLHGEVNVEALHAGDLVVTAGGAVVPIVWIGQRRIVTEQHPTPADVWPVRVARDALSAGTPARDLYLSPDHALYLGDGGATKVLIPVRYLINGASITQPAMGGAVTYFHIELARHDILLAEAAPAESFLDTGNRGAFANATGAVMMTPDFARRVWNEQGCTELVVSGPRLSLERGRLLARAVALDFAIAANAAVQVVADGQTIMAERQGCHYRVTLPQPVREVRLICRSGIPGQIEADGTDFRRLGAAVTALTLDGVAAALDDSRCASGWHAPEPDWRWTDGDATLLVGDAREIAFDVVIKQKAWASVAPAAARIAC